MTCLDRLTVEIDNLHCPTCEARITQLAEGITGATLTFEQDKLIISADSLDAVVSKYVKKLVSLGFLVSSWEYTRNGNIVSAHVQPLVEASGIASRLGWKSLKKRWFDYQHVKYCNHCQHSDSELLTVTSDELPSNELSDVRVVFSITGMTCVLCVNAIHEQLQQLLPESSSIDVDLLLNRAVVIISDRGLTNKIIDTIEDMGFEARVAEIVSVCEGMEFTRKTHRYVNFKLHGVSSEDDVKAIIQLVSLWTGDIAVEYAELSVDKPYLQVTYKPSSQLNIRGLITSLSPYKVELIRPESMDEELKNVASKETSEIVKRLKLTAILAIPTFVFSMVTMFFMTEDNPVRKWTEHPLWVGNILTNTWILFFLATPIFFCADDMFHQRAFKELKQLWFYKNSWKKRFLKFGSMDLLMSLGTSVSYFALIGLMILLGQQPPHSKGFEMTYFDSVVFLTFFVLVGRYLGAVSRVIAADSVANLGEAKSVEAVLVKENTEGFEENVIEAVLLDVDDTIRVRPGELPAVDCVIIEGVSEFDESALTGESRPVLHQSGHQIYAGSVNCGTKSVLAKINTIPGQSLIDDIVMTVRNGQLNKAPIERTADTLTGYFVPLIILLATLTLVVWLVLAYLGNLPDLYRDNDIGGWLVWSLEFLIAVFVIACPCGIGLAAPTALYVGSGLAAKYGILAKGGGLAFQDGAQTNVVCFDKTGTLTHGKLEVTDFVVHDDQGWQLMWDLETASNHPIALALRNHIKKLHPVSQMNTVPEPQVEAGKGVFGAVVPLTAGEWPTDAILGNEAFMNENGVQVSSQDRDLIHKWKLQAKLVVMLAARRSDKFELIIATALRDNIREEARDVIQAFENRGIECWMITGDNYVTALVIANELGISNVIADVLPHEKQAQVKQLQERPNRMLVVAMIGDGINDAPALTQANVGVALSLGTDLAMTSLDFIILNKSTPLVAFYTLLDISRIVFRRIRFNFGWALVYNIISIPIAAGLFYPWKHTRLNPAWAAAAMALLSISVVMSSLALRMYHPKNISEMVTHD